MDLPALAPVVGTIISALLGAGSAVGVVLITKGKTKADIHSQVNQSFKLLTDELQEERSLQNTEIRELRSHNDMLRLAAEQVRGELAHYKSLAEYRGKEIDRLRRRLRNQHEDAREP